MNSSVKTTATSEPLITDAFLNLSQTIKSPKTKSNYIHPINPSRVKGLPSGMIENALAVARCSNFSAI